ncbi:AAA family ATPase [Hyphomicrobium sp. xq]|uniref:AAA family ATPase n=1 Tax=Hyphomicrobium album TaxID=2665159 RepID=A0A6I3KM80_9HYPH|nr:AAA family ATPase [Hyphomicrobium album]MTD93821.1 AAA family ATPase [Hyphomicrobium album]
MKIRAIRLKEVGRFSAPVALEGLTGGLDVLAGPNELGKSTILKAVNTALFLPHTSKKQEIEELRPYAGGAPLIELDLEVEGRGWRLRKQYLSSRSAELRDLSTGQVSRGADAETQLAMLLGGTGHFALLCVEQGAAMASMAPVKTGGQTFMAAIESEIENVTDGSAARFVAERVKSELATLLTSHNPPRPTGALKTALDERDGLVKQRDEAQGRLERAQMRLDELERLRGELAALSDAAAMAERVRTADAARQAFEEARDAREKYSAAAAALVACERQLGAAQTMLESFERRAGDLSRLETTATETAPLLADCEARAAACSARTLDARGARTALRNALTALERDRKALERSERLAELTQRLDAARAAHTERTQVIEALAGNGAEDKVVDAARREAASIARIEARLTAAAPRVSLAYAPGAAGKVRVDGRPLADGEMLQPTRPITLEIAGIGVITIAPGQSDDVAQDEADLAAHRRTLAKLLQSAGAATLDDAERLLAERRDGEARLSDATARLKASAPEGMDRLQRSHAELAAQAAAADALPSPEGLEARAAEVMEALGAAETQLTSAEGAERDTREELVDLRARATGRAAEIEKLVRELGTPDVRASVHLEKREVLATAQSALNAAVRDAAAWREKAPDETSFADLKRAAAAAEDACQKARNDLALLRQQEAGLLGELKTDRADDVAARLDELNDLVARAEARCRDLQEEASALQLLAQELDASAARTRDRFAKPVVERLAPYLQLILPQARLVLGEDLAPQSLERGSAREDFARLSGGTQEQLGLLVRLAFARLLADTGTPAPLIIDDAVVNTDDDRLMRLFQALQHAAQRHQVLVLSCRQRDFDHLGGHRIALSTWEDARAAA